MTSVNKAELRRLLEAEVSAWACEMKGGDESWPEADEELHNFLGSNSLESVALSLMNDCDKAEAERDAALAELKACRKQLGALIHISDATGWERHTCGEIEKARALLVRGSEHA